jgi:hypothetical protein
MKEWQAANGRNSLPEKAEYKPAPSVKLEARNACGHLDFQLCAR